MDGVALEAPEPLSGTGTFRPHCGQNAALLESGAPQYMQYCPPVVGTKLAAAGGGNADTGLGISPAYLSASAAGVREEDFEGYPPDVGTLTAVAIRTDFGFVGAVVIRA